MSTLNVTIETIELAPTHKQIVQTAVDEYIAAHGRGPTAKEFLDLARVPGTALHDLVFVRFPDDAAAEMGRLLLCYRLLRSVRVTFEPAGDIPVRAYVPIRVDDATAGAYTPIRDVARDPDLMADLLARAKRDLSAFYQRYRNLEKVAELSSVFSEIARVISD